MIDNRIGCVLTGLTEYEHAEIYKYEVANILSNIFLSDLSSELRNDFHSFSSSMLAILNDGIVLPI